MEYEKIVLQKLRNKAKSKRIPFQLVLQLFCQEEFLRRLSRSEYREKLILKGGLFLFSYSKFEGRPTMDIDFLARQISNDQVEMKSVIQSISEIHTENSFIKYEIKSAENIAESKAYHGVRVKVLATISNTKTPFDIDIGVGDIIIPEMEMTHIPPQLEGFLSPEVSSYSLESTIAEKLEAMFDRMEATSRMKDYYDIYYLANHYDFNARILTEAIDQTFKVRNTRCSLATLLRISSMQTNQEMIKRWNAFSKKSLQVEINFEEVLAMIVKFLRPIIESIDNGEIFSGEWSCDSTSYIDI